jgi:hypothetical protein
MSKGGYVSRTKSFEYREDGIVGIRYDGFWVCHHNKWKEPKIYTREEIKELEQQLKGEKR